MASLSVRNISKQFGSTVVLKGVSFEVGAGEFFSLLGPSGCGKSTLLRIIAGLENADQGTILVDNKPIDQVAPQKRGIGMVFQQYALWPHMTVAQNVAFGLDAIRLPKDERNSRLNSALERVRMTGFERRYPHEISGGQQQRVALARALAMQPSIILLDEPLSNLDARLRAEIRDELAELHHTLKTTMIYVTHDQEDALALSTRIAVIDGGAIQQIGSPREIYAHPSSSFVAKFIGDANLLPCTLLAGTDSGTARVKLAAASDKEFTVSYPPHTLGTTTNGYLCVRPSALHILSPSQQKPGHVHARVKRVTYKGAAYEFELLLDDATAVRASVRESEMVSAPNEGDRISISWEEHSAAFVPAS